MTRLEPISITFGATVISDTLSLIVFAICVPIYQSGFSVSGLVVQLIEIAIFVPLILFGLSRLGAHFLKKVEDHEDAYFVLMLAIVGVAGLLAQIVNLPGIVGAFLAGLAVNSAVHDKPAKKKLEFFGNSFFIPGPVLTEHFAPRLLKDAMPPDRMMRDHRPPDALHIHKGCIDRSHLVGKTPGRRNTLIP